MKTALLVPIVLVVGLAAGGGAAFGTGLILGEKPAHAKAPPPPEMPSFVPTGKILAPLVYPDGRLAGYVSFEAQLEVPEDKVEFVTARLPVLLNAVNLRTYHTPMASGPDGMLPELTVFRGVLMAASVEAFGRDVVKRAAITQAAPG